MSSPQLTPAAQQLAAAYAHTVILIGRCREEIGVTTAQARPSRGEPGPSRR